MLTLPELIIFFTERLQMRPPITKHDWADIYQSTLAYLNGYRQLQDMLDRLAGSEAKHE